MFWDILFYGIIIVGAILMISLTAYRIDWARHPEKYKDLEEDPDKVAYKKAAAKKAKEKEKALKRQKRVDKINHYRAISGQTPIGLDGKPKDGKNKKKKK